MSDLWTFSLSSPPPIIHHSTLSQTPPSLNSPSSFRSNGNPPHAKVTCHQLTPQTQVSSPYQLPYTQVASPNLPPPQVTSPNLPYPQITSPHHLPHSLVTSPHYAPQSQATPSYPLHQVHLTTTSHHLPHSQIATHHLVPSPQVTSTHVLALPQNHLSSQSHDQGLDNPNWNKSEQPSGLSCPLNSYSYCYQNQTTVQPDLRLQNHFGTGVTHHRDESEDTNRLSYNTHTLLASGVYGQDDASAPGEDTWESLEPAPSPMQCSPLCSISGGMTLGRWSSLNYSSSSTEDFSNTQFFPDGYHDSDTPQSYCSPTTPGPSPHYPQTPNIPSPGPQMLPRREMFGFHTQTSTQLGRDQTLSCCLNDSDCFTLSSEASQLHPHQTSQQLLPGQTEPIQDHTGLFNTAMGLETGFSPRGGGQNVSRAARSPSLHTGPTWKEECGEGGRSTAPGGGGGGRGAGQPDWTWMKRPKPKNSTKVLDSRLLCTVCKRDFRSLPALNGHMRSHSGFRSARWLKKGEDSSPSIQPSVSMVIPVSMPVQSRGRSKACRGGQRRCGHVPLATRGAVLYRSLMHLEEEKAITGGNGGNEKGDAAVSGQGGVDGGRGHYTPSPMLCPLRAGPGLFCSLITRKQKIAQTVQPHNAHNELSDIVATEKLTTGIYKTRINVGPDFQAEIPPLCSHTYTRSESQNALLLWTPWGELEEPVNQQRVKALLTMAQSSVVPGGRVSLEHALHVLSECRGDFLLTVEKLLSTESSNSSHTGVNWSAAEMRLLVKSLQLHHKDFSNVQRAVQTKSLPQCVEFYYLWKKKLSLRARSPAGLTVTLPSANGQRSSRSQDAS